MGIREFELFHGAVLTKIMRNEQPVTLRLVETHQADSWAAYTIDDQVELFVKHSLKRRSLRRSAGASAWTFVVSKKQLQQMASALANSRPFALALVCGRKRIKEGEMEVCLLEHGEVASLVDTSSQSAVSLTVRFFPGKSLRVLKDRKEALVVPRNRLDKWILPSS